MRTIPLLVFCFFPLLCAASEPTRHEFDFIQMGVPVRIVLYTDTPEHANKAADAARQRIAELNAVMSDYDSDSEIARLTRNEPGKPIALSADLFAVLQAAKHYADMSDGAFDVTVGPFTQLWRRAKRQRKMPEPYLVERAEQRVGNDLWELDGVTKTVTLKRQGMRFDLGGIAKGYAIDQAFETITKMGIETVLVDAGGDFRLGKAPPGGWKIDMDGKTASDLENIAVAASGDSRQFLLIGGVRYSHIIDPKTGLGLTHSSTVRVFAPTAMEADALASTLSVLEPERGKKLIETLNRVENECGGIEATVHDENTATTHGGAHPESWFQDGP